jgi:type IV secretion system protein VirB6
MATPNTLFENIYDGYNGTFGTAANTSTTQALATAAGYIQGTLGLYVLICGFLILTASLSFKAGMSKCVRALIIAFLLTPAAYNQWVTTTFTQTIPQEISTSTGGVAGDSGAQVFDQLLSSDEAMLAQALTTAGYNPANIGKIIAAYLAMLLAEIALLVAFFIWFLAYALVYVVVCIGPYVLLFWLFDATRDIPMRLFGKLVGYMLLMAMVLSLTQIIQNQEKAYVTTYTPGMTTPTTGGIVAQPGFASPDGSWLGPTATSAGQTASGGNLDEQVSVLCKIALAFLFGAALMIMLPGIAAYIGGGIALQIAPMVTAAMKMVGL